MGTGMGVSAYFRSMRYSPNRLKKFVLEKTGDVWYIGVSSRQGSYEKRMSARDHVVGVDLGTSSVRVVVGRTADDNQVEILGHGSSESDGLRKGTVVNIERTVESIETALRAAQKSSGRRLHSAFTSISDGHIQSFDSHGIFAIRRRDHEIAGSDVTRVLEAAQAVKIPVDREVLHVFPKEYMVDGQHGINDPVGIVGVRLEADVHIVTGASTSIQNIIKCMNRAGCEVEDIVLDAYASGESALTREERELGVALIDFGGGTTDCAVFSDGVIRHSNVLALAGSHVTNDIAIGLRTPAAKAEDIKMRHGCALVSMVGEDEVITVNGMGKDVRHVLRGGLVEIIEARMDEILGLVNADLGRAGCRRLFPAGLVLTGGSVLMDGTAELAEAILKCPVRIGRPLDLIGDVDELDSPEFACATGLVRYGLQLRTSGRHGRYRPPRWPQRLYSRVRDFLENSLWGG